MFCSSSNRVLLKLKTLHAFLGLVNICGSFLVFGVIIRAGSFLRCFRVLRCLDQFLYVMCLIDEYG